VSSTISFPLEVSPEQSARLRALQVQFAEACNHLAPVVRQARCWNRVALHHLTYKALRQRFPQLGAQMACNAIYSVCRSARVIYQHPQSPWHHANYREALLPLLRFMPDAPVYFDRHTLSIKGSHLSMFTLNGRMHFKLSLSEQHQACFRKEHLREIALLQKASAYALDFHFGAREPGVGTQAEAWQDLPQYLIVQAAADMPPSIHLPVTPVPVPDAEIL